MNAAGSTQSEYWKI